MPPKKTKSKSSKYARSSRVSQNSSKNAEAARQAKIRVIVNGVDVTPRPLLPPEVRASAAATLGDPNASKTFMGDFSIQSFGI